MSTPLLEVRDLTLRSGQGRVIVSGVDLTVGAGETIGIVGESGSGKSMTARALMGLLPRGVEVSGSVTYQGRELLPGRRGRRLHDDFAMVFQDPFTMLNPLMRAGRHISETLRDPRGRRLRGAAARKQERVRLAEVGIHDPSVADRYPFELSGGMRQRVGIAATLSCDPTLLLADEPTTALDVTTQAEILALLKKIQRERDMGMVLITHDLGVAFGMCDRIYVLYAGQLVEVGPSAGIERRPLHPYTQGLLDSEPPADRRLATLTSMPGSVPRASDVLGTCPFADRCAWVADECRRPTPLRRTEEGRSTACVRIGEIGGELARAGRRQGAAVPAPAERRDDLLVEVRDLRKDFTRAGRTVHALRGVTLEVGKGESVGIVGESGSGKTTLGRCLVGLETPTGGTVRIGDVDAGDYARLPGRVVAALRSRVQMAFQDPYSTLSPARSIGAVLKEAIRLNGSAPGQADGSGRGRPGGSGRRLDGEVAELLALVGLPAEYAGRKPAALSGGERQRVALARALARKPDLIVCDEIVSALDVSVQAQILTLLTRLQRELGVAYVFITHDLAVVRQVTDRLYVLRHGQLVESGATEKVLDEPEAAYTRTLISSIPARTEKETQP
ncbi:dipeptide ABC transporter ATP-binding protein [Nonomuraea phyllanthi]|uniref:Dipeptide ABC transporter ATP-binding protein n=1 Tax=Nonomuraea phyllanthi TaxID=2219224 RepID=A0A5C4W7Z1_9ACTN|nr:ABC transporter ATP-binding protein [Nonomuraea phyllanthi]KAB8192174.1 dipeptide ABC transporter ATP-binding protein [Nonomuraea phyllanthi]